MNVAWINRMATRTLTLPEWELILGALRASNDYEAVFLANKIGLPESDGKDMRIAEVCPKCGGEA